MDRDRTGNPVLLDSTCYFFTLNLSNQAEEEANVDFKPVLEKLPGKFKISPKDG